MTVIFEPVTIGWQGKEYEIKPTLKLLTRIEEHVSLVALARSTADGEPRITQISKAIAVMLQSVGVEATEEQIYQELMHGGAEFMTNMMMAVVMAAFPHKKEDQP